MHEFRGPAAMKFIHGLICDYGQFVVKVNGLFNVRHSTQSRPSGAEDWLE